MIKLSLITLCTVTLLTACSTFNGSNKYQKPDNLLFINKELNTYPLTVQRDDKLCDDDQINNQKCPIKFYIDDFKAGDFYIKNKTNYYLKPNEYELTVKNCKEECKVYHTKINISETTPTLNLILTIDHNGKPFIINKES